MPAGGKQEKVTPQSPMAVPTVTAAQNDGEYTDQELLNLVNYYEVSRVELKNVGDSIVFSFFWSTGCVFLCQRVDSLLAQPILKAKQVDSKAPKLFEGNGSIFPHFSKHLCETSRWLHQVARE